MWKEFSIHLFIDIRCGASEAREGAIVNGGCVIWFALAWLRWNIFNFGSEGG